MKVAIVGSRDFPRMGLVYKYVSMLPEFAVVLSGGARGVDQAAAESARERGLEVVEYPADWEGLGRRAGMVRNAQIVNDADLVVAYWDGESRGTKNAIDHARNMCKPFVVVFP